MVTGIPEGFLVFRDGKQVPIEALAGLLALTIGLGIAVIRRKKRPLFNNKTSP